MTGMPGAFGVSDVELSRWWRGLGMERMEYVPVCVCVCVCDGGMGIGRLG